MKISYTYLDHNATTAVKPVAREAFLRVLESPANASSVHKVGRIARREIEAARARISALVNASSQSVIVFTSGATEANNLVLKGAGCDRVLVSAIEHPSVLNAVPTAEIIPVLPNGVIDLAALDAMLEGNDRQTLISVMLVNNETGVIQPVAAVMDIAKRRGALVHTDAVQAAGRMPVDLAALGVDYMTLSSHKIGGVAGAGCLIMANCVSVMPQILGGGQEKGMRAGTENAAAIASFGAAAESAVGGLADYAALGALRDSFETRLADIAPQVKFFGRDVDRVPNTSMFCLPGAASDMQLIALDMAGICVSNGSACASGTVKPSHVLTAMGATGPETGSALRISLGWNSTEKDVECFLSEWKKIYDRIQQRRGNA